MNRRPPVDPDDRPGRGLWIGLLLGVPLMGYGIVELLANTGAARALSTGTWVVSGVLLHDLLIAPAALTLVWATAKLVPGRVRTSVRAGLLGTLLVVAVGWAPLNGYGNRTDNPTVHPLDYSTAVLTSVAAVWALVTLGLLAHQWSRRRRYQQTA